MCWHGISLDDEHLWDPYLYLSPGEFRRRLEILDKGKYHVLPLHEALERLAANDLPPRSVALTFDDGFYDFFVHAAPAMADFGFPSTVYLTTYYVDRQVPIFNLIVSYMLWKSRGPGRELSDGTPLVTEADARAARGKILAAVQPGKTGAQKEEQARSLAGELHVDYDFLLKRRLLHLMNAAEVSELTKRNVTFEAHTHRHCMPPDAESMRRELRDNMNRIEEISGRRPQHFCYPSGNYRREHFPVFEEEGLLSATTCHAGISSKADHRFLVPRLLDHAGVTDRQYEGWISGLYAVGRPPTPLMRKA